LGLVLVEGEVAEGGEDLDSVSVVVLDDWALCCLSMAGRVVDKLTMKQMNIHRPPTIRDGRRPYLSTT
jgi:hypothetical protein